MNAPDRFLRLPDIQEQPDTRNLPIDAVGIKDIRYPLLIQVDDRSVPIVATLSMTVSLPAARKGTHMSRFVELLEAQSRALDQAGFKALVFEMLARLDAV